MHQIAAARVLLTPLLLWPILDRLPWLIAAALIGVATGLVSVPLRYMHSPNELVHLEDIDRAARLLAGFARSLKAGDDFIPR